MTPDQKAQFNDACDAFRDREPIQVQLMSGEWADTAIFDPRLPHRRKPKLDLERQLNLEIINANDAYMARAKAVADLDAALAKLAKCREALDSIEDSSEHAFRLARETLDATI